MTITATAATAPTQQDIEAFMGQAVTDFGAAATVAMVLLGDQLGFYRVMAATGSVTPEKLASETGTHPRLVREWLSNQTAARYVTYDPADGTFTLPPAAAFALSDPESPVYLGGLSEVISAVWLGLEKVTDGFRTGKGVAWHEHDVCLFRGTERFFRPGYAAHLVEEWLPMLDDVVGKLTVGAKVADIGCGHGASTVIMARAFPRSTFTGFDYHAPSIQRARDSAGALATTTFQVASAVQTPDGPYDLVCTFDCLHDMGNPIAAATRIREVIAPDGTWLLVEPFGEDALEDNINPVGRLFYGVSTAVCTSHGVAQGDDEALGAQAGLARLAAVAHKAGFTRVRLAGQTPFNLIIEVRP